MIDAVFDASKIIVSDPIFSGHYGVSVAMVIAAVLRLVVAAVLGAPGIVFAGALLSFWVCWRLCGDMRIGAGAQAGRARLAAAGPEQGYIRGAKTPPTTRHQHADFLPCHGNCAGGIQRDRHYDVANLFSIDKLAGLGSVDPRRGGEVLPWRARRQHPDRRLLARFDGHDLSKGHGGDMRLTHRIQHVMLRKGDARHS